MFAQGMLFGCILVIIYYLHRNWNMYKITGNSLYLQVTLWYAGTLFIIAFIIIMNSLTIGGK